MTTEHKLGRDARGAEARAQEDSPTWRTDAENFWENRIIFGSRWLLAPAYLMLVLVLAVLAYKTVEEFVELVLRMQTFNEVRTIAQILIIIDIVLVMNLVLMVLFVGYVNFVSIIKFEKEEDAPKWLGYLDYSGLKIQLIGSIIAISGIMLLRVFVDMIDTDKLDTTKVVLMISLHMTFVISALVLALVNRLKHGPTPGVEEVGPL
jgi:uncharacterized protein (TIGR00645 family)